MIPRDIVPRETVLAEATLCEDILCHGRKGIISHGKASRKQLYCKRLTHGQVSYPLEGLILCRLSYKISTGAYLI